MQTGIDRYRTFYTKQLLIITLGLSLFACQEGQQKAQETPDAVRDLLIDRTFRKTVLIKSSKGDSAHVHRFTITNTSHRYTYQRLKIRFDYYDNQHRKIDALTQTLDRTIEPRTAITVDSVQTGLAKPAVRSTTVTVMGASAR